MAVEIYRASLTLKEHTFFASREIGMLYETEPLIGNYALAYALGPARPVLQTADPATEPELNRDLADPRVRTVWFLRNTHDVSPAGLNRHFEALLQRQLRPAALHAYEPFSPLETWLMRRLGMPDPPTHFQELLEYRR